MSLDKCSFCNSDSEYTKLIVKKYNYWRIELHTSQSYLGRCAVILNDHKEDFFDISLEEREELFKITKDLQDSLKLAFHADMLNYATLGNIVPHVHLHVIPRYKDIVIFEGIEFTDERWGQNYAPYNKGFKIEDEVFTKIKDVILTHLENR